MAKEVVIYGKTAGGAYIEVRVDGDGKLVVTD